MRLTALALAILFAGCSEPSPSGSAGLTFKDWTPLTCDPSGATRVALDAPLVPGLRRPIEDIVQDVVDLLGEGLGSKEAARDPEDLQHPRWATTHGELQADTDPDGAFLTIEYDGRTRVTEAQVRDLLDSWQVPDDTLFHDQRFSPFPPGSQEGGILSQRLAGLETGAMWANNGIMWHNGDEGRLVVMRFHVPLVSSVNVTVDEAVATASVFERCRLDDEGKTEASGYRPDETLVLWAGVWNGTIAHVASVAYDAPEQGHCGWEKWVYVDALTGAVILETDSQCA